MHSFLREYRALKRVPLLSTRGDSGTLQALAIRDADWKVVSVLAYFGKPIRLAPEQLECSIAEDEARTIRVLEADDGAIRDDDAPIGADAIEADRLLGCRIVGAGDEGASASIQDLLINLKDWYLRYFVVDTGDHAVLLHSSWVTAFVSDTSCLVIDALPVHALASAPVYPGVERLTPGFEDILYRHYTRREFAADAS
jgi:hypothetical protein